MSNIKKFGIAFIAGTGLSILATLLTLFFPVLFLPWLVVKSLLLLVVIAEGVRTYHQKLAPLIEQKKLKWPTSLLSLSENFHELSKQEDASTKQPVGLRQIFSISTVVITLALTALLTMFPAIILGIGIYIISTKIGNLHLSCLQYKQNHKDQHAININKQPLPQDKPTAQTAEQNQETANNQNTSQNIINPETPEEKPYNNHELTHNAMPHPNLTDQTKALLSNEPSNAFMASTAMPLIKKFEKIKEKIL